ncbi:hypothetical protein TNCV_2717611 [Trichonephila clavipes]|nr:hypothetical protein TNCV_2717611 [Trichonephila clavipes]
MDEPSNSDSISNDCLICAKIGCSSELSSELGDILKVTRGISTLKTASVERADGLSQYLNTREFVYVHSKQVTQQLETGPGCEQTQEESLRTGPESVVANGVALARERKTKLTPPA